VYPFLSNQKKKGKEERGEETGTSTITNFSIKLGQLSSQPFTLYPSVRLTLQTRAAPQLPFFLLCLDYGTPLSLRKSSLLSENSQNKAKETPSLSTAGISPSVAGAAAAAAAGVRPAHGQREVEQDQRSDAGPAEIRQGCG
jgi:hypothetical protein